MMTMRKGFGHIAGEHPHAHLATVCGARRIEAKLLDVHHGTKESS